MSCCTGAVVPGTVFPGNPASPATARSAALPVAELRRFVFDLDRMPDGLVEKVQTALENADSGRAYAKMEG
ncbi:hypothetical protein BJF85_19165 [Saccharomonospora sp. CUA-673]|uniref:hypothetical protein n=1 Tax=Saccharomonospora sp. CUA-673 TaxID=1904969 RepID=UPI00096328D1|nr:hypothetical protein [Saccharomonospora sp. CUA-673]OLT45373.1 hypothetical protein BJF85_19165 [Saccharomonospora sp. CUA-673]